MVKDIAVYNCRFNLFIASRGSLKNETLKLNAISLKKLFSSNFKLSPENYIYFFSTRSRILEIEKLWHHN